MGNFIPEFHFRAPAEKLKPEWCNDAIQWAWFNCHNLSLLEGKNIQEIEGYASGDFDMEEFKKMYKSMNKAMTAAKDPSNENHLIRQKINTVGVGFYPLPLIPTKLNSAISVIQKIPVDVAATAQDALAAQKKKEDITFLKNKPKLEADLQPIADQMNIGKVDLGTTQHSSIAFSDNPYGLDLNDPDEAQVFSDLLYNLAVEAAFETVLQQFWELKNGDQVKLLEIEDQMKFGVSVNRGFESSMTDLPDMEYVYPADMRTPFSRLPDYSDNTHRFWLKQVTALELFNYFSNEICDKETLYKIVNGDKSGYCACNSASAQPVQNFGTYKMNLIYCEIKSIDYVGVAPINKNSKYNYIIPEEDKTTTCTNKIWGQNTYGFWWLENTKSFFGIHRLGYSHRTKGHESYQNYSTNINRSQKKSAVEQSIGENKKAQVADLKMQHTIIMSLPPGRYFDLKYMRQALEGLLEEDSKWTLEDLMNLALEKNTFVGDSQGFDSPNAAQFKPVQDIIGGIKLAEIAGYMQVITDAGLKIGQFTGINDQLTGQSANPEGLIGLQKLLINSSINALHYSNVAIQNQVQKVFTLWATSIKAAVKKGGASKQAIIDMIGAKKVSLIEALDDLPLHDIGIKVSINQREEERQEFKDELARLKKLNVINTVDEYMLTAVVNPKDRMALLAVKVKQWEKKQEIRRQQEALQQQAIIAQQGKNQQAAVDAKTGGDIKKVYAQGDVSSKLLQQAGLAGSQAADKDALIKKSLQQDRGNDQTDKAIKTLQTKSDLENQQPLQP